MLFWILAFGLVMGGQWYRANATRSQSAQLNIISGTVLIRKGDLSPWVSATTGTKLKEGDSLKTDGTSQAFIVLFDNSTMTVFAGTELKLSRLAISRFKPRKETIVLEVSQGKAHFGVATTLTKEKRFRIDTPQATALLTEGSFALRVEEEATQVRVQEQGKATVIAQQQGVELKSGEMTEVTQSQTPTQPQPAGEELVTNGDFSQGLNGWRMGNILGFPQGRDVEGTAGLILEDGRPALRFFRQGSQGSHCETYIYQDMGKDVSEFSSLRLSLQLKLVYHNLSGGGYMGSEYPVFVRINYLTNQGENSKVYGFYYQNDANNRTDNGIQQPRNQWINYQVPDNLMALDPQPRRILSIQVSASGWNYESLVREISLTAQ
ncbi:MAG: FecR domain-containing protein [Chloroflexi bacterium]|nr:FecR domain-containing protein [Chloroflexota bacterium]